MLQRDSDSRRLFSSRETFANDCEMGASCVEVDVVCLCEAGPCTLYSEAHTPPPPPPTPPPTPDTRLCEHCGKSRVTMTRFSEGYGTEEECLLSDPQGESDADADIEDTDCRLHEPGSLQRISSRRRKRPRVSRQDTTESEDDGGGGGGGGGGRSHAAHRWNLRLSPDRGHSRTILEESISQVRPLIICRPNAERPSSDADLQRGSKPTSLWPTSLSLPLVLLLSLPLSLSLAVVLFLSFLLPSWASA